MPTRRDTLILSNATNILCPVIHAAKDLIRAQHRRSYSAPHSISRIKWRHTSAVDMIVQTCSITYLHVREHDCTRLGNCRNSMTSWQPVITDYTLVSTRSAWPYKRGWLHSCCSLNSPQFTSSVAPWQSICPSQIDESGRHTNSG